MKFKKILIPLIIVMMVFMMALPSLAEPVTYPDGGVYCDNLYDFFTFSGPLGMYKFSQYEDGYYSDDLSVITKTENGVQFYDPDYALTPDDFWYCWGYDLSHPSIEYDFSITFYAFAGPEENGQYLDGLLGGYVTLDDDESPFDLDMQISPTVKDGIPYYTIDIHEEYICETGVGEYFISDNWFSLGLPDGADSEDTLTFVQVGDMEFYVGPIRPEEPTVFENVISNTTGFIAGAVSWVKLFAQTIVVYPLLFVFVIAVPLVGLGIGLVTRVKR